MSGMKTFHIVYPHWNSGWLRPCSRARQMSMDELLVWIGWFSQVFRGYVAAAGMKTRAVIGRPKPSKE